MKKAIVFQVLIFIAAWSIMTPDVMEDNTYVFGLFGSHDVVAGNSIWVMIGAGVLSIINIWLWWPKTQVTSTHNEKPIVDESTKSAEAAEKIDEDPKTPTLD